MKTQFIIDECEKCRKKSLVALGDVEEEFKHIVEGNRIFIWQCMECKHMNQMPVTITASTSYE